MRIMRLTRPDGKIILLNSEHVVSILPPLSTDNPDPKVLCVVAMVNGERHEVRDSPDDVVGWF